MTEKKPVDSHYARLRRRHRSVKREGRARKQINKGIISTDLPDGRIRLYGLHTVEFALRNPRRTIHRLLITKNIYTRLNMIQSGPACPVEIIEPKKLDKILGADAVHQGIMIETEPLPAKSLESLHNSSLIMLLDQITDPHNVGAIMRSAVAFNVDALITTTRYLPQESGILAKAASGALELIDHVTVRNLADTLEILNKAGFQTLGLDSEGEQLLEPALSGKRIALVLGAEGKGLRQRTRQKISRLVRLDIPGAIKSLNVSNAAAIALYRARSHLNHNV